MPDTTESTGRGVYLLAAGALIVVGWLLTLAKEQEYICSGVTRECLVRVDTVASRFGVFVVWVGVGLAIIAVLATSRYAPPSRVGISIVAVLALALGASQALAGGTTLEDHRAEREREQEALRALEQALAPTSAPSSGPLMPSAPASAFVFDHGWANVVRSTPPGGCMPPTDDCRTVRVELTHACSSNVAVGGEFARGGRRGEGFSSSPRAQDRDGASRFSRELPLGVRDLPADVEARITSVRCQSWAGGTVPPNGTAER